MLKKFVKILFLIILISINLLGTSDNREFEVKEAVEEYFKTRYESLGELRLSKNCNKLILDKKNDLGEIDILDILVNYRKSQPLDLAFDKYNYNLNYIEINIKGKVALVTLEESHRVKFNCMDGMESRLDGLKHRIELRDVKGKWMIYEDKYIDDIKEQFEFYREKRDGKITVEDFKKMYTREIDKNNIKRLSVDEGPRIEVVDNTDIEGRYKKGTYNRNKASEYAKSYALKMNNKYMNYEKSGGDCTNFTSQCLREGGINLDFDGEYKWFWYSDYTRSPSWTSAKAFRIYALNNNGSANEFGLKAYETTFDDIDLGDLIQYTEPTHTMIATGCIYENNGVPDHWKNKVDILISQRSSKEGGRLVNYPLSSKPETKGRFYIKICCYYY